MRHYNKHIEKIYRTILSCDRLFADIYLIGGDLKACFHIDIEDGKAVLKDTKNHTSVVLPIEEYVVSRSEFYYDEEEDVLSAKITLFDGNETQFSSKVGDLMDAKICSCDKPFFPNHNKPLLDKFATKHELIEEARRRKHYDDKIFEILGVSAEGQNSISSQINTLEMHLNDEITRSKARDINHYELIAKLQQSFENLSNQSTCTDRELRHTINTEIDTRSNGYNQLYKLITDLQGTHIDLVHKIDKNTLAITDETQRAKFEEQKLHSEITAEADARIQGDEDLHAEVVSEQTARIESDEHLETLIQEESDRAIAKEDELANLITEKVEEEYKRATAKEDETIAFFNEKIQDETNRAIVKEDELGELINTEVQEEYKRATTKEDEILATIDAKIQEEAERANTKDSELQTLLIQKVVDEYNRATAKEDEISSVFDIKLQSEVERAKNKEIEIISSLETTKTILTTEVNTLTSIVNNLKTKLTELEGKVNILLDIYNQPE